MNACHNGAKDSAKVHLCQACLDMLIIKGFMGVRLAEMKRGFDSHRPLHSQWRLKASSKTEPEGLNEIPPKTIPGELQSIEWRD
jgi:hypothetical protein